MHNQDDLKELKNDVERAFKAAIFSMDYCILRIILDSSKEITKACEKNDSQSVLYFSNKAFWDIGICIQRKINNYSSVSPTFFEDISLNIRNYLKIDSKLAFTPENLMRCLKIVDLANEDWFNVMAKWFSWEQFASSLDKSSSFGELKTTLGLN